MFNYEKVQESSKESVSEKVNTEISLGRPSYTALSIVVNLLRMLDGEYGALLFNPNNPRYRILLLSVINIGLLTEPSAFLRRMAKFVYWLPHPLQKTVFNSCVYQGYDALLLTRKLLILQKITAGITEENVKQVVILAGGYDPMAFLLSEINPEIKFYELDRGLTRYNKLKAFQEVSSTVTGFEALKNIDPSAETQCLNKNFFSITCDFTTQSMLEVLQNNGFNKDQKTLLIAEGLFMYLMKEDAEKLFRNIYELLQEGDELIVSFLTKLVATVRSCIQISNEECHFLLSSEEVIPFLATLGFKVKGKTTFEQRFACVGDTKHIRLYENNPDKPRENYYLLGKSACLFSSESECLKVENVPYIDIPMTNSCLFDT